MQLHQLRYFVAVAEEGHIGRAGRRVYVSQQAVSSAVAALERELGVQLLRRHSRGVELTAAGTALHHRARRLLDDADALVVDLRSRGDDRRGRLVVGLWTGRLAAAELTPLILDAFRYVHPEVDLVVRDHRYSDEPRALERGDVDVALVRLPLDGDDLRLTPILQEPRVVVLPADHRLAATAEVGVVDVLDEVFASRGGAPPSWWAHESLNEARGGAPRTAGDEIAPDTVERWIARRRATGSLAPTVQRHGPAPIKADALAAWLPARLDVAGDADDATLAEHVAAAREELGLEVSVATLWRAIAALPPPPDAMLTATGRLRGPGRPLKQRPSARSNAIR